MKLLLAITFCGLIWAQSDAAKPEIRGVVIEPGIEHGIPDVDITIFELGGTPLTGLGRNIQRQAGKVTTDSQGKFSFQPEQLGDYQVIAEKEGYSGDATTRVNVTLSADHPSREMRFLLARTGEITGRVLDDETGEPIAHFAIEAAGFYYQNGVPQTGVSTLAQTDDDGRFTVHDLVSGRYVVIAYPRMRFMTSDTDLETGYQRSYWPGGRGLDIAAPITLNSGGSTDIGIVRLRKAPLYQVRVTISEANCRADETVNISAFTVSNQFTESYGSGIGTCGQEVVLRNFPAGSYGLVLTQGKAPDRSMTSVRIDIADKDVDLRASLAPAADVEGHLIAAEGVGKIQFEKLRIVPVEVTKAGTQYRMQLGPTTPDSQGRFWLPNGAPFGKFLIWLIPTDGAGDYIKEIRFNGVVVTGKPIVLDSVSPSLEIVVDDQPAIVTGVVNDGDHPASKPYIVLSKWPLTADFPYARMERADGDEDGKFRFTELAPGEYRAIAVSQSNRDRVEEPGVLQRLMSGTEPITLDRGSSRTITLKLTDPSR